jgi:hypothetical protein
VRLRHISAPNTNSQPQCMSTVYVQRPTCRLEVVCSSPIHCKVARGAGYPHSEAIQLLRSDDLAAQPRPVHGQTEALPQARRTCIESCTTRAYHFDCQRPMTRSRFCQAICQVEHVVFVIVGLRQLVIKLLVLHRRAEVERAQKEVRFTFIAKSVRTCMNVA